MSIAGRHYDKTKAQMQSERAGEENLPMTDMSEYQLMLGKLRIDLRRLKSIKSIAAKVKLKIAEIIPAYVDYVEGILEAASGVQDDVLLYNMIWLIDAGDYDRALDIAEYALEHDMKLPERFKRDLPELITEYICNDVLRVEPKLLPSYADILQRLYSIVGDHDMHDAVNVKLNKAVGFSLEESDKKQALFHLKEVYKLDTRASVKKHINSLEKQLTKKGEEPEPGEESAPKEVNKEQATPATPTKK